jgi:molybdopterin synthase catalytic subunit
LEQALAAVESDTAGAAVSFSGIVRNHDDGKPVSRLSYSAHPTANAAMNEVVRRVAADYANAGTRGKVKIWVGHRLGMLEIGDPALICAVSASHRAEAFQVCSDLVDRVKAQVPIWKEQFFRDGSVEWVGAAG